MKKVLLTGFEPFLDNLINPTEDIVQALHQENLNGWEIIGEVIPVDFHLAGEHLVENIHKVQPSAIISLGLAAGRNRITPERIAINCNEGPKDNQGYKPDGEKIIDDGPDGYFSTLPIKTMVKELENNGIPAKISNTAGAYVCNHVMYRALHEVQQKKLDIPSGFIHIPASHKLALTNAVPSFAQKDLQRAIEICIGCLDYAN
ncbi:pyroglutamyl-peptidase I [Oceanobacillus kimchii]|uniref:pyroglutamyl-peptidase I n=1 Tax=Oceanobacillus kimchii TaxID=746691 RepID=UPI00232F3B72|nr:pyroglutamyl-peptidase I [Oceanobacillus kimchii]